MHKPLRRLINWESPCDSCVSLENDLALMTTHPKYTYPLATVGRKLLKTGTQEGLKITGAFFYGFLHSLYRISSHFL